MARHYPHDPDFMGPPALCTNCGKQCCGLHMAGSHDRPGAPCYHCSNGLFLHRLAWKYKKCPEPHGMFRAGCVTCNGTGVVATRKEPEEVRRSMGLGQDWVAWWADVANPQQLSATTVDSEQRPTS